MKEFIEPTRICKKCGQTKHLIDFTKHSSGYRHECKQCFGARRKVWYVKNKHKVKEKAAARYSKRPYSEWTDSEKDRSRQNQSKANAKLRKKIIKAYGGVCQCCGEAEDRFLTVDHVNNDGAKHRREIHGRSSGETYRWIIKNDYPESIQILCMNCNFGKSVNNGICPHQEGATTIRKE